MKPTGAAQVGARDERERARLPVSGAIIITLDSMIVSPQRAMVGRHQSLPNNNNIQ